MCVVVCCSHITLCIPQETPPEGTVSNFCKNGDSGRKSVQPTDGVSSEGEKNFLHLAANDPGLFRHPDIQRKGQPDLRDFVTIPCLWKIPPPLLPASQQWDVFKLRSQKAKYVHVCTSACCVSVHRWVSFQIIFPFFFSFVPQATRHPYTYTKSALFKTSCGNLDWRTSSTFSVSMVKHWTHKTSTRLRSLQFQPNLRRTSHRVSSDRHSSWRRSGLFLVCCSARCYFYVSSTI